MQKYVDVEAFMNGSNSYITNEYPCLRKSFSNIELDNKLHSYADDLRRQNIAFIQSRISQAGLLGQLAEECAELANACCQLSQAALKLQRSINKENPPRKSKGEIEFAIDESLHCLTEELADIDICLETLGIQRDDLIYQTVLNTKPSRWVAVLKKIKEHE